MATTISATIIAENPASCIASRQRLLLAAVGVPQPLAMVVRLIRQLRQEAIFVKVFEAWRQNGYAGGA